MLDLSLAIIHHLAVFALLAILAVELVLVRPGMSPAQTVTVRLRV